MDLSVAAHYNTMMPRQHRNCSDWQICTAGCVFITGNSIILFTKSIGRQRGEGGLKTHPGTDKTTDSVS